MSRTSRSTSSVNPIKVYVQFQADSERGYFTYWDGSKEVSMESVDIIVMDTRQSIGGYSAAHKNRIYSNLTRRTKEQSVIKCGKETIFTGSYADNKDKIKALGGKFQTNVFCLIKIEDDWKAANLQLTGGSVGAWMSFLETTNMNAVYDSVLTVSKGDLEVQGRVKYFVPKFETSTLASEDAKIADEFEKSVLAPWLASVDTKEVEEEPAMA